MTPSEILELSPAVSESSANAEAINRSLPIEPAAKAPAVQIQTARIESRFQRIKNAVLSATMLHKGALSLADQAIVSGTNFFTLVLIRHCAQDPTSIQAAEHNTGLYQLAFSIVTLVIAVQTAVISGPYAVFAPRMGADKRRKYAGSALVHHWLLALGSVLALAIVGTGAIWQGSIADFGQVLLVLAMAIPFILVREFVRRFEFAHLRIIAVMLTDMLVAAIQLSGLAALKASDNLSAATALATTGIACAAAGLAACWLLRGHFQLRNADVASNFKLNWSFGRWSSAAQIVYLAMAYGSYWMLAIFVGTEATGRFTVCMSLVMFANPILLGLSNFLGPQAIHTYHDSGITGLRQLSVRTALWMAPIVVPLCLLLVLFGAPLLRILYNDHTPGEQLIVSILSLNLVLFALSMAVENGLVALNRPAAILRGNAVGLIVTFTAGAMLIWTQGVIGAAIASVIGTLSTTGTKGLLFVAACRELSVARSD